MIEFNLTALSNRVLTIIYILCLVFSLSDRIHQPFVFKVEGCCQQFLSVC